MAEWQGVDVNATLSVAAAVGSAVAAWGAARFAQQQASAARAQNSLTFLADLGRNWDSDECREWRAAAARDLLEGTGAKSIPLYRIMRHFEEIGVLLERKALDPVV